VSILAEYACVILYIIIQIKMLLKLSVKSNIRHNKVYPLKSWKGTYNTVKARLFVSNYY